MRAAPAILALVLLSASLPVRAEDGVDAGDLWRHVRHHDSTPASDAAPLLPMGTPFFVVAPSIGSKPSTGITVGLASNVAFVNGDPATTRLSVVSGGLKVSEKGQTLSGLKLSLFFPDDRWSLQGDNRFLWTSQNTYDLGGAATSDPGEDLKYDQVRVYETIFRTIAPGLFVGAGVDVNRHGSIRAAGGTQAAFDQAAYTEYSGLHGFNLAHQTSSGTTVSAMLDTRDNQINARRGWLVSATYRTFFNGFMGGSSSWQEAYVDVRTYRPLTSDGRRRLAVWMLADLVAGGVAPYLDLPTTAGDSYGRSARGYTEGRYRGTHLLYGEVEYRDTLTSNGLLGYVAFLNTTTIDSDAADQHLFDSFAPGAGGGLRVLLNKKSRTNLCVDYGWGKQGSRALYLAIQEAF